MDPNPCSLCDTEVHKMVLEGFGVPLSHLAGAKQAEGNWHHPVNGAGAGGEGKGGPTPLEPLSLQPHSSFRRMQAMPHACLLPRASD